MSHSVTPSGSRPASGQPSRTPTPSLGGRNTPSSLLRSSSSLLRPTTADTREQGLQIRHGVLQDYSYRVSRPIRTVLFDPQTQQTTVLNGQRCDQYLRGRRRERFELRSCGEEGEKDGEGGGGGGGEEGIWTLLYASDQKVYVGVCKGSLKLFNQQFECYFEAIAATQIVSAVYNSCSGEVITGGKGNITVWAFRQGGKIISPSQVIKDGLQDAADCIVSQLHLEEVPGKAQRCFTAVNCGIRVYQVGCGRLLSSQPSLHQCPISALLFFRPLRLLVTAGSDGAIKVWDSNWRLCCTFIGHRDEVTALSPYPHGPLVVSASLDATLRIWDLCSHDQVESVDHTRPVTGLYSTPGSSHFLSHSERQVRGWRVQQLYERSAIIGRGLRSLTTTTHPLVPTRLLANCEDSAVRLVSPTGGHVITTALLPLGRQIVSLAYFSLAELLYVLEEGGTVTAFDTAKNPCAMAGQWTSPTEIGHFTCLALYELAMDEEEIEELLSRDRWLGVTLEARKRSRLHLHTKDPLTLHREGMSLLLAGTNKGHLVLLDHTNGTIKFSLKVHHGPVTLLACNPKESQILSASNDNLIHVCQLYPHVHEALSLMMSFHVTSCPSLLTVTQYRVGVACNDHTHSCYSIDMYCLQDKVSFTGESEHSHHSTITHLASFPPLHLMASTSDDRTLRIWTEDNHPVRVLHLDGSPQGMVFSSSSAQITIALHSHLHCITASTYLPEQLLNQLLSMQTSNSEEEVAREMTSDLSTLPPEDQQRLEVVDDTIQEGSYRGALSVEEMAELEEAAREKARGMSLLLARDNEIKGIRDGIITSSRKRQGLRVHEKEQAWRQLLSLLHPRTRPPLAIPEEDDFDPDTYGRPREPVEPYSPYQRGKRLKFFPPLATFDPPYPLAPDCLLPNSALLQQLRKSEADWAAAEEWAPPTISDQQRRLMAEMEAEEEEEEEETEDSDLQSRLQAALQAQSETASPTPSPSPPPSPPPEPPKRKIVPRKIEKLISRPPPKPVTPPPHTPTPPPPKSPTPPPTPPPPPTPLPEYISQFIGQAWFDKLYPNANSSTFPRPWSVSRFIFSLLSHLAKPSLDSLTKADICRALLLLLRSHSPSNTEDVHKTVLEQLTTPPHPTTLTPSQRPLVTAALSLLFHINIISPQLVIVGMVHGVEGGVEVEGEVVRWLEANGMDDPHHYFTREMNKMAATHQETAALFPLVQSWLESWAEQLRNKQLRKAPKGRGQRSNTQRGKKVSGQKGPMKGASSLPPYNPIEVINYFIKIEHENELSRLRVVTPPPAPPPEPEEELPHNTVITLPKITRTRGVARLGETHCSCCHPERETTLALIHRLPPLLPLPHTTDPAKLWSGFSRTLSLAMKPQNINPFLTEEEQKQVARDAHHTPSLTSTVKYFVPERSYVTNTHS